MDPPELRFLEEFQARLSSVELNVPRLENLAPKRTQKPVMDLRAAVRPRAKRNAAAWRPRLKWTLLAAALAALCVAALRSAARWASSGSPRAHRSFALPLASTAGLAAKDGALYTLDPARGLLAAFTAAGSELKVISMRMFSGAAAGALAWGEDCIWSTDAQNGRILRHRLDADYTVATAYANAESRPTAVYWDGSHLWASDARTETILRYGVDGVLTPQRQYALPGMVPAGIRLEEGAARGSGPKGAVLWVFDSLSRRAYAYGVDGMLAARDSIDFRGRLSPGCRVTGFAQDGGFIWIVTENPAELHRFDLRYLKREADSHGTAY